MTAPDLLGVPLDVDLLWRLVLSVAAVLLVSVTFWLYSSREDKNVPASAKDDKESENANFQNHKKRLRFQRSLECDTEDGSKQPIRSEELTPDGTGDTTAGARPQDAKTQDAKTQDTKTQDTKTQDAKTQDTKTQDAKTQDTKTQDAKTQAAKTQAAKTQDTKTQDAKTQDAKTQDAKTNDTKTQDAKTEAAKTEAAKTQDAKTEAAKTQDAKTEDAKTQDAISKSCWDKYTGLKGETGSHQKQEEDVFRNILSGSDLSPTQPTENGMAGPTGRRSPCFVQKLEGTVEVGRELRQDLECQGACSSFLSRAEIKVKDANVVLQGTGDQVAHGKIYDYYVASSSRSITESDVGGEHEKKTKPQPVGCGPPSLLTPIVMHDVVSQQSTNEDRSSMGSLELTHPGTPALLRKTSSAAEQSELFTPPTMRRAAAASAVTPPTPDSNSDEAVSVCLTDHAALATAARASSLDILARTFSSTDVEAVKAHLDLSTCLEALYLARRHGQVALQQAALQVMSDNYLHVLRDPNLYGQLLEDQRKQIQNWRLRGRSFVMVADMDPQDWARNAGGAAAETSSAVYYYDDYKDSWHWLCPIPQEVASDACAICTMDNYLFVAVGYQGAGKEVAPSKRVFCYNPLTSVWKEICPLNEARPRCKLAALEGYIYAIGGECTPSVERYDPYKDRWTFVAPLPSGTFAVAHHVTVCKGELYVCGGALRYMLLRYTPQTNMWRAGLVAGGKVKTADMVAAWRSLYRFDINPLLGISVYRYHTVARLWYECCTRRLPRCPAFRCVAMDDVIYCVGRQLTMRFDADEVSPAFVDENLSVLSAAKGQIIPFVLTLPDRMPRRGGGGVPLMNPCF